MALTGLHVACGYAGHQGVSTSPNALLLPPIWSRLPASNTPTTDAAPEVSTNFDGPIFSVISSADAWVAIGPTPDPTNGPRRLVLANQHYDFYVRTGDKLAWIAA